VWSGEFERVDEAFAFEKQIQGWGRKKREALISGRLELLSPLTSRSRRRRGTGEGDEY
jgi:putative endonuclease